MQYELKGKQVFLSGGASFIASHLIGGLLDKGVSRLVLVDDLSSGKRENIEGFLKDERVEFVKGDLRERGFVFEVMKGMDLVVHFAAVHGGRGFIGYHDDLCIDNFLIDRNVVDGALSEGVERFFYASSGCVYPLSLQDDPREVVRLSEEMAYPPFEADGIYGTGKLMGEVLLKERTEAGKKMEVVVGRFFTVYGERALENHAVMGLIAKAYIGQDPYEVWGDGGQVRNWTYVEDTVEGMLKVLEKSGEGFEVVNIGSGEGVKMKKAVEVILEEVGHEPERIKYDEERPEGPVVRVADVSKMKGKYGWRRRIGFREGVRRTVSWYKKNKQRKYVRENLERLLTE